MRENRNNGITLIALVITIIIMLILAGVTITLVLDENNGVIRRANVSAKAQIEQQQRDTISFAYTSAKLDKYIDAKSTNNLKEIDLDLFERCLKENEKNVEVEEDGDDFLVYFPSTKSLYTVSRGGKIVSLGDKATFVSLSDPVNFNIDDNGVISQKNINGFRTGLSQDGLNLYNLNKLSRLVLPTNTTEIGAAAFSGHLQITKLIMSNNITYINASAFSVCTNLNYVVISSKLTNCGDNVFYKCDNLKKVEFNGGENGSDTIIPNFIFAGTNNLEEIIIPSSVKSIGKDAFAGCPSSVKITYKGTKDQWNTLISNTADGNNVIKNANPF